MFSTIALLMWTLVALPTGDRPAVASVVDVATAVSASIADEDLLDRPITRIDLVGLEGVQEQVVWNNLRTEVGMGFDPGTIRGDIELLTRLGHFSSIEAIAELQDDGTVVVAFRFQEQPVLTAVQVVGNKILSDQELLAVVGIAQGMPRDEFLIERGKRRVESVYHKHGYLLATVIVDQRELDETDVLIYRVVEGPRVKVRAIDFEGVRSFEVAEVQAEIESKTWIPLLRRGELDDDTIRDDVQRILTFYEGSGYLDARVGSHIELSPDNREAKVVFLVEEGPRYLVGSIRMTLFDGSPLRVFTPSQLSALLPLRIGDTFTARYRDDSIRRIEDAYARLGYLDVSVQSEPLRVDESPTIDVVFQINEGRVADVGVISIHGNQLTKDNVIRRHVKLQSGRRFDGTDIERTRQDILRSRLFQDVRVSVQEPASDESSVRDVIIEVTEKNTGSLNFGVGVGSDSGVLGSISLVQNNFDIADLPRSWSEFLSQRAFRGAGQQFAVAIQPGDEIFDYSISLREPHFLESDYSLGGGGGYRQRVYEDYSEHRTSGDLSIGRRFGDIWTVSLGVGQEHVELVDIEDGAPQEIYDDAGPTTLDSVGLTLKRTTISRISRPGKGSALTVGASRYGILGDDVSFWKTSLDYTVYLTLDRDFLGRLTTLKLTSRLGRIFGDSAPTYERFYLGGRRLRGFEYRTVSPKGTPTTPEGSTTVGVGGTWMMFLGAQYEFPIFGEFIDGVVFLDSGTVTDEVGIDEYRIGLGVGVRLYIPQLGPTPMAFDFAIPLQKQENDRTEVFSFSAELPF